MLIVRAARGSQAGGSWDQFRLGVSDHPRRADWWGSSIRNPGEPGRKQPWGNGSVDRTWQRALEIVRAVNEDGRTRTRRPCPRSPSSRAHRGTQISCRALARYFAAARFLRRTYDLLSFPFAVVFLFHNRRIHAELRDDVAQEVPARLADVPEHPADRDRDVVQGAPGDGGEAPRDPARRRRASIVECGCWKGGSTANLSLVCRHRRSRPDRLRLLRGPAGRG